MEKDFKLSVLNDIYGTLLTERQSIFLRDYYDYDLSLAEIAENRGITRQAARDTISAASSLLYGYEEKLKFLARWEKLLAAIKIAQKDIEEGNTEAAVSALKSAAEIL